VIALEGRVHFLHDLDGGLILGSDHNAIRAVEIVDRSTLLEKLRVGDHGKSGVDAAPTQLFLHGLFDFVSCANRNG